MTTKTINILHLEDEVMDVFLVKKVLQRSALDHNIDVVSDKAGFLAAITKSTYDIVLADHSLPQFTAMDALQLMKDFRIDIPFILVTGTVSEEFSVNAMKEGAWDYILKDRLQRLPIAVEGAIEKYFTAQERKKYFNELIARDALMKEAEQLARFGSWHTEMDSGTTVWSDELYRMLGYEPEAIEPNFWNFHARVHPEDKRHVQHLYDHALVHRDSLKYECRILAAADSEVHIYSEMVIRRNGTGEVVSLNGFIRDISENVSAKKLQAESELKFQYVFENNPIPTWIIDAQNFQFIDVNNAALSSYGYTYEEFLSMTAMEIRPEYEKERFGKTASRVGRDRFVNKGTWRHCRKDGTVFEVEILSGDMDFGGRAVRLVLAMAVSSNSQ